MAPDLLIRERGRFWTRNLVPGQRVYGELVRRFQGKEYRDWAARRSKVAAYMEKGGRAFRLSGDETILYLGAASGTTVSHLSDLLPQGRLVAVEVSPRPFRDLLGLAASRPNVLPVLSDAHTPEAYAALLDRPADVVIQDIAQRDQADIFRRNLERLGGPATRAFLAVKARSVDVAAAPPRIYERLRQQLSTAGLPVHDVVELDPFETDHAMFVVGATQTHGGPGALGQKKRTGPQPTARP